MQDKRATSDHSMIVALDIGTSKVVCLVGEVCADGGIEIVGVGSQPSHGMKRGVVVNIESTVSAIQRAVEEAELMAGCKIHSVTVGIAGNHISSLNSHGIVAVRDREVSEYDLERVIDAARAVAIPADQRILHILPQEYLIDTQEGIKEPLGMSGVRLEAKVHLVTGASNAIQNIDKCIRRCGLEVDAIVLEQLASSYAVLAEDEKDLGVCIVDIGGGTTDIAVFTDGSIRHTAVIPIAGDQVTNDIAMRCVHRRSMPKKSRLNMPVPWHSWLALMKPSRCPVWAIGPPEICRDSLWLKWSSRVMKSCLPWCRPSCDAQVLKT